MDKGEKGGKEGAPAPRGANGKSHEPLSLLKFHVLPMILD